MAVFESFRVSPCLDDVDEMSLLLTVFDILWLPFPPTQRIIFYEFASSKNHFVENTIPTLKHSLSLALSHFYPVAGKIIFPSNSEKPRIRFRDGDSISLIFAESNADFGYLIGNHQRNVADFHPLLPELPPVSDSLDTKAYPVLAVKVTFFPNRGVSFGFTVSHAAADGTSFIQFIKCWASITKLGEEATISEGAALPFYDRTVVKCPNELESNMWNKMKTAQCKEHQTHLHPNDVLSTFLLRQSDLQRLKKWLLTQCPTISHVSKFTIACAYVWSCLAKVKARSTSGDVADDELENFVCAVNCRTRLDPLIPENYFGNCLVGCFVISKSVHLIGRDGFLPAAKDMGESIRRRLSGEKGAFKCLEETLPFFELEPLRTTTVAGSPRLASYDIDFGWGKPKKCQIITDSISLHEGRDNKEDLEIGSCLSKIKMDMFTDIFVNDLKIYD